MPIWNVQSVARRPSVTLEGWSVREVPLHGLGSPWTRHLIGYSREDRQGQISSPVVSFDHENRCAVTQSGRVYRLIGHPGAGLDADYVWRRWMELAAIVQERDVTAEVQAEMILPSRSSAPRQK
jgi:hypothetical protein